MHCWPAGEVVVWSAGGVLCVRVTAWVAHWATSPIVLMGEFYWVGGGAGS